VKLGKIRSEGKVSREAVAEAVVAVLGTEGAKGWIDMLDGPDNVEEAVKKLVKEGVDSVEDEDFEAMKERASKL
jgi:hypothetical protein